MDPEGKAESNAEILFRRSVPRKPLVFGAIAAFGDVGTLVLRLSPRGK